MENWLSITAGVYLLVMVLHGHSRGFIRLAVSMVALIASMMIVHAAMPHVTSYLREHTSIQQSLSESMKKAIGMGIEDQGRNPGDNQDGNQDKGQNGNSGDTRIDGDSALPDDSSSGLQIPAAQRKAIEELKLPQSVKDLLIENNNSEVYELLGVDRFVDYVGNYLSDMILNTVGFALLFLLVYAVLQLIMRWLDLLAKLPILSGINKIAGAVLGAVEGLVFLWLFFLIATAFSGTEWGYAIMLQIEKSSWLSFLYANNILNIIVMGIIHGIL